MAKIRKGDEVVVIAGKDKGRRGVVKSVLDNTRAVVEGVNVFIKHVKPNPQRNIEGGKVEREGSIHLSNLAIYNPATKKADRVGYQLKKSGKTTKKVRIFKSNKELVNV